MLQAVPQELYVHTDEQPRLNFVNISLLCDRILSGIKVALAAYAYIYTCEQVSICVRRSVSIEDYLKVLIKLGVVPSKKYS